jgi:hypothetical protein
MKFLILMYGAEGVWPEDEHKIALQESIDLCHDLHAKGQYCGAAPLQPVSTATCVRVRDGKRFVTDGPFAETKEQLGGYFLIDVDNLDEAIKIAGDIPGTRRGTTEIRPIVEIKTLPKV